MAQTDADKAAGIMRFTFGSGEDRRQVECRALPNGPAHRWFRDYRDALAGFDLPRLDPRNPTTGEAFLDARERFTGIALDSIRAWDPDNLPSREWLADHATNSQFALALADMKDEAGGPFGESLVTLAALQAAVRSPQPSSTNGQSPIGDTEVPETSTKPSRRRR